MAGGCGEGCVGVTSLSNLSHGNDAGGMDKKLVLWAPLLSSEFRGPHAKSKESAGKLLESGEANVTREGPEHVHLAVRMCRRVRLLSTYSWQLSFLKQQAHKAPGRVV